VRIIKSVVGIFVSLGLVLMTAPSAQAQDWPQRTVRLIIGFGAGGGTDIVGRIVAQALQERLGRPFIVENKPGGSGIVGAEFVAKSEPDGHTLYLVNNAHIILGVMNKSLPFETIKSFEPIGQIATGGLAVVTHPDFPAKTIKELIENAKANPGKITFASVGPGTTQHFTGELFKQAAGVDMLHIPFRGSPAAIAAVMGKQVDVLFDTVSAVLGQVQSNDLKALAVTSRGPFPSLPGIPPAAGVLPDYEVTTWYGIVGPAGTPAPVVARLNKALVELISDKTLQERLEKVGAEPLSSTPEAFRKHMEQEFARWNGVREAAGLQQQ
jgi:tripartite-type tricarboxylate transporter receptor subunit TctC